MPPRSVLRAVTEEPAKGRSRPSIPESNSLAPGRDAGSVLRAVTQKRKGCGAHPQTNPGTDRAAVRLARVPQKPAQGRLGPSNDEELGSIPPSQVPLCGRVPQKPAQGRLGPPNDAKLASISPRQAPLRGRAPQKKRGAKG